MVINMDFNILVLNIGSTSLKFKLYEITRQSIIANGQIASVFSAESEYTFEKNGIKKSGKTDTSSGYGIALEKVFEFIGNDNKISAIAFKTVMAGNINRTCELDEKVVSKMEEYLSVAPAHNLPYINAIREIKKLFPDIPCVGSFETAFHSTIPKYAYMYSIDSALAEKYGIRKYGFHGAAHSYAAYKLGKENKRLISVHLGGSSSVCAILDGKSLDTSMGFSPQSGLPMNNRCGDIDAFALLYLMEKENMSINDAIEFLSTKCGFKGMSRISNDMRELEKNGCDDVIEAYAYSASKYICSFLPCLGGVDAISFSGGIAENSTLVKQKILNRLKFSGAETDDRLIALKPDKEPLLISTASSKIKIYITPVNEELMVALNTYNYLKGK